MPVWLVIILRIIHILSGVAWAGAAFTLIGFIGPTVGALGPDGGKFMSRFLTQARFTTYIASVSGLTVLSGLLLYWNASFGLSGEWMASASGLVLTVGALAGLGAMGVGIATGRASAEMVALSQAMATAGGPPSPAQLAQMQGVQQRLNGLGRVNALLLAVTIIGMATFQVV
ncbi:MAG: hypothetical protein L0332_02165 [Chloroflexi bacterium]|nr:hypothetical protein [Chloroflexota bacterium]MCI0577554.1 hypothetical protein [Chloroflexota bacterium]MCI0645607.1 hypothetical protein [Chloroflexota bacterium]MCI0725519.1 hypothetical protein [Chloroflexota bacterium]